MSRISQHMERSVRYEQFFSYFDMRGGLARSTGRLTLREVAVLVGPVQRMAQRGVDTLNCGRGFIWKVSCGRLRRRTFQSPPWRWTLTGWGMAALSSRGKR